MKGRYDYQRGYMENPSRAWLRERQEARASAHRVQDAIAKGLGYGFMAAVIGVCAVQIILNMIK